MREDAPQKEQGRPVGNSLLRPPRWKAGDVISGRFQVHKVLRGLVSHVFIALDRKAKEIVAIRTCHDRQPCDAKMRKAFVHVAKKWLGLGKHRNIIQARNLMTLEGMPSLVLQYARGRDMGNMLRPGALKILPAIELGIQFCRGMEHIWGRFSWQHRGLRPLSSMILDDMTLKITDFGIIWAFLDDIPAEVGRIREGSETVLPAGALLSLLPYMAPECIREGLEDEWSSDIYSFGVFFYEMLLGRYPVPAATPLEFIERQERETPEEPRVLNSDISQELEHIMLRCLEKDREKRFRSFHELGEALQDEYSRIAGRPCGEEAEGKALEAWESSLKGHALDEFGYHELALFHYERSLELNPAARITWTRKGMALSGLARHREALKCFEKALSMDPRDVAALVNRGHALASIGRRQEAIKSYDEAVALDGGVADAPFNKACVLAELGSTDEARELYDRILETHPRYDRACYNRASLLQSLQQHEEALELLDRSIIVDPRYAMVWLKKGLSLAGLGRHQEALADFRRALELSPDQIEALLQAGNSLVHLERFGEAHRYFDRVLEISPRSADAWFGKAYSLAKLGRPADALLYYDRVLAIEPGHVKALLNKGITLFEIGKFTRALLCFDQVLSISRSEALAWYFKGLLLYKKMFFHRARGHEEAMNCFHNAVTLEASLASKVDSILGNAAARHK